jgi:cation diffusion facilitator CzcD-associated flavoprotein CzcO
LDDADLHDLVIIGGGIGGVICLKYASAAGLDAILLERKNGVGGIWHDLPAWQDIQIRKEDWTLGSLPIAGEDQSSIVDNINAWVERFDLSSMIRLNTEVSSARPVDGGWEIVAGRRTYHSRFLVAATGGHNRAVVPEVERAGSTIREHHSSTLEDPTEISGRRVVVVGGGASAYDLLDLCFEHNARSVTWVYRSLKWMRPTRKKKYFGTDVRFLAKQQMLGVPIETLNRLVNRDLRARYQKARIEEILPGYDFDFRRHQLIPGRRGMIANFGRIERQPGEIVRVSGSTAELSNGHTIETDTILWGTGYAVDLSYFSVEGLSGVTRLDELERHCGSLFLSLDAANLFFLAPAVLETVTSTPWAYAHAARSIVSHIRGGCVFDDTPIEGHVNHYDLARFLARRDRANFIPGLWYVKYLVSSLWHPKNRPLPIP